MQVVIQCAGQKNVGPSSAQGHFRNSSGKRIKFLAQPQLTEAGDNFICARPDDPSDKRGLTWRQQLLKYNEKGENPFGLLQAFKLYRCKVYRDLVEHFGIENVFILSAGWGLIRADFLTPAYDITFKSIGDRPETRRCKTDQYFDFQQLPIRGKSPIVCFVTGEYRSRIENLALNREVLFCQRLDAGKPSKSLKENERPFKTRALTNWHYSAAQALISGELRI